MRITHLSCTGFRGIRDRLDLDVPIGFLVVTGRNGAGKSSLCDLVEFALTGELRSQQGGTERREKIGDYIWWRGEGGSEEKYVSVRLADREGNEFEVRRTYCK